MKNALLLAAFVALSAAQTTSTALAQTAPEEMLTINENNGTLVISVPASALTLTIPKGTFAVGSDPEHDISNGPRYFKLADMSQGVIVSGWFESDDGYKGIKELWASETAAWKQHQLPDPQHVAFMKVGKWEVVSYDVQAPKINNVHLRCEWVAAGTWIDMHISVTTTQSPAAARATALKTLRSIRVTGTQ